MSGLKGSLSALGCMILLAACGKAIESAQPPSKGPAEETQSAYTAFLSGNLRLLDSEDIGTWGLDEWGFDGELEYTFLDLDGDGAEELLLQWVDAPGSYNGVFHEEGGTLRCWQHDAAEGTCRDYPLEDGTMVRQYDVNGASSYTLFRYLGNGESQELSRLFVRGALNPNDRPEPCPYYAVDGKEVDEASFQKQLNSQITDKLLNRSAWIALQ